MSINVNQSQHEFVAKNKGNWSLITKGEKVKM